MTRVVESVAQDFGHEVLQWEVIYTKKLDGAIRYGEISQNLGRPAPIPSILIEGKLVFDQTPSAETLRSYLEKLQHEHLETRHKRCSIP